HLQHVLARPQPEVWGRGRHQGVQNAQRGGTESADTEVQPAGQCAPGPGGAVEPGEGGPAVACAAGHGEALQAVHADDRLLAGRFRHAGPGPRRRRDVPGHGDGVLQPEGLPQAPREQSTQVGPPRAGLRPL
ncbi:unnamed protein product, partial [Prorocentrum cordatum]